MAEVDGVGEYAAEGYAQKGWQVYDGKKVDPGTADILYTPPVYAAFDDGLRFPLTWSQISDGGRFSNTLDAQKAAIEESFKTAQELSYIQQWAGKTLSSSSNPSASQSGISSEEAWKIEEQQLALASSNTPYVMEANPIVWTALIKPCSGNGPFTGSYAITVSDLEVPEGVNLAAASSP